MTGLQVVELIRNLAWFFCMVMAITLVIADKTPSWQGATWTSWNLVHAGIFALLAIALKPVK